MPGKRHSGSDMVEHDELVGEIIVVEKMSTAERLKHAKKRRQHQLKKFSQYEKQLLDPNLDKENNKKTKKGHQNKKIKRAGHNRRVEFVSNIMVLEAAARNDIDEVKNLLKGKVSPDVTNEDGLTALHQCCIDDLEEMLRLLLEYGANVNAQDSELWTPLHAAATCGHIHLCKILIDHGAELLSVNADGNMPYDICEDEATLDFIENEMAKRGVTQDQIDEMRLSSEIQMLKDLKKFAEEGGDLEYTGRVSETPLHIAAANGYLQVTEFLLSKHTSVNVRDDDSWQPIHAAACWGHLPVLELLVQHGADLDAKTKNGETPYDICEDIEIRERLMELKSEMAAKGHIKSRNLVRRRSTNTRSPKIGSRNPSHTQSSVVSNSSGSIYNSNTSLADKNPISASVRRVSSKDKGAIAHKEAMEEAGRLRESVSDKEDNDDTEQPNRVQNGSSAPPRKVEDIHVFMPVEDTSPEPSPRQSKPAESPPLKAATKLQPPKDDNQKSAKPDTVVVIQKKPAPVKPSRGGSPEAGESKLKGVQKSEKDTRPSGPPAKGGPSASNTQASAGKAKEVPQVSKLQKESANKKSAPEMSKPVVVTVKPESNESDATKSQKKSAPQPPAAASTSTSKSEIKPDPTPAQHTTDKGKENIQPTGDRPTKPGQPVMNEPSKNSTTHHPSAGVGSTSPEHPHDGNRPSQESAGGGGSNINPLGSPPQGTLSDLKKQRALKLQEKLNESLRFKDSETVNQEITNHNANHKSGDPTSANPTQQQSGQQFTNGHNGKVPQPPPENNNAYPTRGSAGDSVKKYKFSDSQSVIGDTDTQTSCCVVQ